MDWTRSSDWVLENTDRQLIRIVLLRIVQMAEFVGLMLCCYNTY
jgi:hypothetical protein